MATTHLCLEHWAVEPFCNPPSHIAQLFHEVFEEPEFKDKYRLISFAILMTIMRTAVTIQRVITCHS